MEPNDPIQQFDAYAEKVHGQARHFLASILAPAAALVGASVWAFVAYVGHLQIGYLAIGIGILVGGAIRLFCHPVGLAFAIKAAASAFMGCLVGNLWTIGLFASEGMDISPFELILSMDYWEALKYHLQVFDFYDIIFYSLSIGAAFRLAYMRLAADELDFMLKEKGIEVQPRESGVTSLIKRKHR